MYLSSMLSLYSLCYPNLTSRIILRFSFTSWTSGGYSCSCLRAYISEIITPWPQIFHKNVSFLNVQINRIVRHGAGGRRKPTESIKPLITSRVLDAVMSAAFFSYFLKFTLKDNN